MRNRTPYHSRRLTHCRKQRHLNPRRQLLVENQALEEVLRLSRIDRPEEDEPLTYEHVEELLRKRGAVDFPRYKALFDLVVGNVDTNIALERAHEPGVFDGDIIYSLLRRMRGSGVRLLRKVGDLMLLAKLRHTRSTASMKTC